MHRAKCCVIKGNGDHRCFWGRTGLENERSSVAGFLFHRCIMEALLERLATSARLPPSLAGWLSQAMSLGFPFHGFAEPFPKYCSAGEEPGRAGWGLGLEGENARGLLLFQANFPVSGSWRALQMPIDYSLAPRRL